jgi:starch phosphorylase
MPCLLGEPTIVDHADPCSPTPPCRPCIVAARDGRTTHNAVLSADLGRAAADLAGRLPEPIAGLATLAYNYRWSWTGGDRLFRDIDEHRWERCRANPVRFLTETSTASLQRAAANDGLTRRIRAAVEDLDNHLATGPAPGTPPVAFICAEFGIHRSLPIYAGGLGVLAGDVLKEASDSGLPFVGVGLFYRQGYFRQRLDYDGWQVEYWSWNDPVRHPMALVTDGDGDPLTVTVPIRGVDVVAQIWRIDVGRVPLFLLDADLAHNRRVDRWITSRLYVADRGTRIAQYALLGRGSIRALRVLGIDPALVHLNEGHAALAPLELAREVVAAGSDLTSALAAARARTVFTTHTPVAAGNETFAGAEASQLLDGLAADLGVSTDDLIHLGRVHRDDAGEPLGMTPLGIRLSRSTNGVSRRHGMVAREMWRDIGPAAGAITHVTNGVHLRTWMAREMQDLLDHVLGTEWHMHASDSGTWDAFDSVSDEALWEVRNQLRATLVDDVRDRSIISRLSRGENADYAQEAAQTFDHHRLTLGFARRLTTYKRLRLLVHNVDRALALLDDNFTRLQVVIAGKAHPQDDAGKRTLQQLFEQRTTPGAAAHVVFLEDYDLSLATKLVAGCDVWINVPQFPMEASGTSGMKAAINGSLNLSILDGWWEEGWTGDNGWGFGGAAADQTGDVDTRDAEQLYHILAGEVVPMFFDRGDDGIPHRWVARVRAAVRSVATGFGAGRMLQDYRRSIYAGGVGAITQQRERR